MRKSIAPFVLLLGGCEGQQAMLGADGRDGALFSHLFTVFLVVTIVFYLLVLIGLAWALLRRHKARRTGGEPVVHIALLAWIGVISVTLIGLTFASWFADRSMNRALGAAPLTVELTAHQWWWDVRYSSDDPQQVLRTSNELHLPAGVPVRVILKSADVIHSFWIPNISGKQDLIPGRINDIFITPQKLGVFRGQCAEFCGIQHAHMAFDVIVEPRAEFEKWWAQSLLPARTPASPVQKAGYDYVTTRECSTCHAIAGTPAAGLVAPDLTHVASRRSIGAGTYPMTRGHLYAWIADPQSAKPGNQMPVIGLKPDELRAITEYVASLR